MTSVSHIHRFAETTPRAVPSCVLPFADSDGLRGGFADGVLAGPRWMKLVGLSSLTQACCVRRGHGSTIVGASEAGSSEDSGGGLRTRVEVTDRP